VNPRVALIGYLSAVVLATLVHDLLLLALGLLALLLLAGRQAWTILRRACLAVLLFNAAVTVAYVVLAELRGDFSLHYVALVNLRVLLLTSLSFFFVARVNPFEALSFSPALSYVLALAYGQIVTLRRVLSEFRLARTSRSLRPARLRDRYRQAASAGALLLDKSMHGATEITYAMRSRGFFDE